ncbi:hypothetical protein AXG93_1112s1230 [Marchantia polymorpha subsp. ruderalis]|uniref:Uncharacterized protein n=1 Tax=Marchantia polymorpha subsp. ruderalis TaxID=1480154 RepID=A0A176WDA9_MARPO|nr:hypothetical protein AXG93_1112s1230 [Marchantia polymorpha subsp. ruderalis]
MAKTPPFGMRLEIILERCSTPEACGRRKHLRQVGLWAINGSSSRYGKGMGSSQVEEEPGRGARRPRQDVGASKNARCRSGAVQWRPSPLGLALGVLSSCGAQREGEREIEAAEASRSQFYSRRQRERVRGVEESPPSEEKRKQRAHRCRRFGPPSIPEL